MSLAAVIIASAASSRLRSNRPAPIHVLCGQPVALYALDAVSEVEPERVVVVHGTDGEQVAKKLTERAADPRLSFIETPPIAGSAGAVAAATMALDDPLDEGDLLVVPGDAPLLRPETVTALVQHHQASGAAATLLTVHLDQPDPAAQVVRRPDGRITAVGFDPEAETDPDLYALDAEAVTGVYCFRRGLVAPALRRVHRDLVTGDDPLSGVVAVLSGTGHRVDSLLLHDPSEALRVTDRLDLAAAEAEIRRRVNRYWLEHGVSMIDPDRTYLDTTVKLSSDVTLFPGTMLQGDTVVGPGAEIGPDTRLVDCAVGERARVEKTMANDAEIGADAHVGPFAVLEAGTHVPAALRTGPFYHASGLEEPGA